MKKVLLLFLISASSTAFAMLTPHAMQIARLTQSTVRTLSTIPSPEMTEHFKMLQEMFPHEVLHRYIKEHDPKRISPVAIRDELIKYAILARNERTGLGMFSKDVDNLWHTFLWFNRDYEEYCFHLDISGQNRSTLYHIPHAEDTICPKVCQWDKKQKFIETYKATFGSEPGRSIWTGLHPCKPSCDPAAEPERSFLSKIDLFNARPTFIGACVWYAAIMATYGGMYDGSLAESLIGLSLGAGRFLYNRIDDRNSLDTGCGGAGNNSGGSSPSCGSGSSGSCGGCGGCD